MLKIFGIIATLIGLAGGILGLLAVWSGESLFLNRVDVVWDELHPTRQGESLVLEVRNESDRLLDQPRLEVQLTDVRGQVAHGMSIVPSVNPTHSTQSAVAVQSVALQNGLKAVICLTAEGPIPGTKALWVRQYEVRPFVPPSGGKSLCSFNSAEMLRELVLTPSQQREVKAGCVPPEFAGPKDYAPMVSEPQLVGQRSTWTLSAFLTCRQ